MRLTKNFTLTELTKTNTGLPNEPNCEEVGRLREPALGTYKPKKI